MAYRCAHIGEMTISAVRRNASNDGMLNRGTIRRYSGLAGITEQGTQIDCRSVGAPSVWRAKA